MSNEHFRFPPDRSRMACLAGFSRFAVLLRATNFFRFPQERRMASGGFSHTVLLRSDGQAVACGWDYHGQCSIPPLEPGISYIQVSAGVTHTLLLRSDGQAVACGAKANGQCSIPPLDEGLSYIQVSAGGKHTVLLRSDGKAVTCGSNSDEQCNIPSLVSNISTAGRRKAKALPLPAVDMFVISKHFRCLGKTVWCKSIFFLRVIRM